MSTKQNTTRAIAEEPWHAETELELLERPGVCFIHLLTDECGCLLLAKGIIPEYLKRQAQSALEWSATEERGIAQRLIDRERHQAAAKARTADAVARDAESGKAVHSR